jgi:5-methylcytosine-specific restriction endonuclease McrA
MKRCRTCGNRKPLAEFYNQRDTADGYMNKCKSCHKSAVSANAIIKAERIRAWGIAYRSANRAEVRAYRAAHKNEARAYGIAYYKAHREEARVHNVKYKGEHQTEIRATQAAYRAAHEKELRAYRRARYIANPKRWRAESAKYRAANREQVQEKLAAYRKTEGARLAHRLSVSKRRSLKRVNTPPGHLLTREQWDGICRRAHNRCYWCGAKCKPTIDHVIPLARGGQHTASNIVASCKPCNSKKRDKVLTLC